MRCIPHHLQYLVAGNILGLFVEALRQGWLMTFADEPFQDRRMYLEVLPPEMPDWCRINPRQIPLQEMVHQGHLLIVTISWTTFLFSFFVARRIEGRIGWLIVLVLLATLSLAHTQFFGIWTSYDCSPGPIST